MRGRQYTEWFQAGQQSRIVVGTDRRTVLNRSVVVVQGPYVRALQDAENVPADQSSGWGGEIAGSSGRSRPWQAPIAQAPCGPRGMAVALGGRVRHRGTGQPQSKRARTRHDESDECRAAHEQICARQARVTIPQRGGKAQ